MADYWCCPAIEPFSIFVAHVYTTMAHPRAEVIVPVGSMEADAESVEEAHPRDARQLISLQVIGQDAVTHVSGGGLS